MRHTLKKYLSNRGSALFMVLGTMTALMISCMAMYFSVISSRNTQYAIFNQQQSYQSAVSLSDAMIASLYTKSGGFESIGDKLDALNEGEVITTKTNGFATFDASGAGKLDDDNVGAYMLEAKRLPDETLGSGKKVKVFDIAVTTSKNGVKDVVHSFVEIPYSVTEEVLPGPTNIFSATGYVPNDVYLDGGTIMTDVFFDNEHTVVNAYGGKNMYFDGSIYCGGSLTINKWLLSMKTRQQTLAVRDTLTFNSNNPMEFKTPEGTTAKEKNQNKSIVMVGRDLINNGGSNYIKNANVYILGDVYLDGYLFDSSSTFFVDGDIYIKSGNSSLSNVYCNGDVKEIGGHGTAKAGTWTAKAKGSEVDGFMTKDEMLNYLDQKTTSGVYYKWDVNTAGLPKKKIHFKTDINDPVPTQVLSWDTDKSSDGTRHGCIIEDITMAHPNNGGPTDLTLIIDTGTNPDNVYNIEVTANRDKTSLVEGKDTFAFFPRNPANGTDTWAANNNIGFQVLVMGKGSVVIKIPEGVIFQDEDRTRTMHYGWYVLNGGQRTLIAGRSGTNLEDYIYKKSSGELVDTFNAQFIHRECKAGDDCVYSEGVDDGECPQCNEKFTTVNCIVHGKVDKYCKTCQPDRADHTGKCVNHIGIMEINNFLASHPAMKSAMTVKGVYGTGSDSDIIYPNVNLFLVSCDENADIRITTGVATDGDSTGHMNMQNAFFGFVYAPYLTFKAGPGGSGGPWVRFCGGLTVSDYVIDDTYTMLACYPDRMPEDIDPEMANKNNIIGGAGNKAWKITLRGH